MRPIGLGDLSAAAGALLAVAPQQRSALMAQMLSEAETADRYRSRQGRAHPDHGNGTLMAAALARPQSPIAAGDAEGLAALALATDMVLARLGHGC